jgi:hypothetical protein
MAHGHHRIDAAELARGVQDGIEQGDERGVAFEGEALAAEVAALQNLLKEIGTHQAFEHLFLIHLEFRAFHALGHPVAALELGNVQEFYADGSCVDAARFVGVFAGETCKIGTLQGREIAKRIKSGFIEAPPTEEVEDAFTFRFRRAIVCRRSLGGLRGLFRGERHTVSHGSYLPTFYFAIRGRPASKTQTPGGVTRLADRNATKSEGSRNEGRSGTLEVPGSEPPLRRQHAIT